MTEKKTLPAKKLAVKIGVNEYNIDFPTNGKLIQIERFKNGLTGGAGTQMLNNGILGGQAYVLSEAVATISILLPQVEKDLNLASLLDLDPMQSKSLIKAYEKYYEWMKEWNEVINEEVEEEK